ncbi:MAG: lipid II flippase MurJ, partial [Burkholderiales bacterium]
MNLLFVGPLAHAGLALAIGLGACLNAGLLYRYLRKHAIYAPQAGWGMFTLKILVAVALMGLALRYAMGEAGWWFAAGWQHRVAGLAALVVLGVAVYGATLLAFGFRPRDFSRSSA